MVKCGARLCRSARGVSACTPSSTMRVSRCYHRRMRIAPRTPNHANATASKNASCGVSFCPRQLTVSRFVACSYREHLQQQDCHGHVQQEHSLCDQHVCRAVWHWRRHQSGPEDLVAGYSQQSWAAAVSSSARAVRPARDCRRLAVLLRRAVAIVAWRAVVCMWGGFQFIRILPTQAGCGTTPPRQTSLVPAAAPAAGWQPGSRQHV